MSKFNVDFSTKKLKGEISEVTVPNGGKINLEANIKGSAFEGVANGIQTNGAFFGANAEELGGVYKANDFTGAFGANKVE